MRSRDQLTTVAAASALGLGLLLLGSAPRWATCVTVGCALLAAVPQLVSRRTAARRSPLLWLLALAALLTLIQLIPLPAAVVGVIATQKLAVVADNAAALGRAAPAWLPLSYDPPATAVELAKLAGYLAFAFACTRLSGTAAGRGRQLLARVVAGSGVAMAAIALIHRALGLKTLFGIYQPRSRPSPYLAPLLNENHLAGFLAFTVPFCLVLALLSRGLRRHLWLGGALLAAGTGLLTESRGGAVSLAVAILMTGVLLALQRRGHADVHARPRSPLAARVPAAIVAACAVVLVATFTAGGVSNELSATSTAELGDPDSKMGVWRAAVPLFAQNLWTGVGRGGFEPAFTRVHHSGTKTYSHVENEYLQALLDWGLPGAAALVLFAVWAGFFVVQRWQRDPLQAGAAAALLAMAVHSTVDFAPEMPGVALAVLAAACILLPMEQKRASGPFRRTVFAGRAAALTAGLLALALAASPYGRTAHADGDELAALLRADATGTEPSQTSQAAVATGEVFLSRHPSDYLIAGLTAEALFRERDARAIILMNRAQSLNPRHPGLHVLTARMLLAGGRPGQALIELSLALEHTMEPGPILQDLLRWFPDPEKAALGIPVHPDRVPVMTNRLVTLGRTDVALAYARRAAAEHPGDHDLLRLVSRFALDSGDIDLAVQAGERAYRGQRSAANALALAGALKAAGRMSEAAAVVQEILAAPLLGVDSWQLVKLHELLAEIRQASGQAREARDSVRAAISLATTDHRALARLYRKLARIEDALGHELQAREARRLADEHEGR